MRILILLWELKSLLPLLEVALIEIRPALLLGSIAVFLVVIPKHETWETKRADVSKLDRIIIYSMFSSSGSMNVRVENSREQTVYPFMRWVLLLSTVVVWFEQQLALRLNSQISLARRCDWWHFDSIIDSCKDSKITDSRVSVEFYIPYYPRRIRSSYTNLGISKTSNFEKWKLKTTPFSP